VTLNAQSGARARPIATIRVDQLRDTLTIAGLAGLSDLSLIAYLKEQRWFGAKGHAPSSARVIDVVPLPWDDAALGIAILEVETASGKASYQMPLAVRRVDAAKVAAANARAVVAKVIATDGEASLLDALEDPVFQRHLGDAFANPTAFDSQTGGRWSIERVSRTPLFFGPDAKIVVGSAEQSNSALIFNSQAFLKLFRKIEVGVQPDVEMTRFLTVDASFPHVPALFGTITYRDHAGEAVAGMLQEYLAGSRDAWSFVLDSTKSGASPASVAREIERIGIVTRELHDALAGAAAASNPDFAPIPVGAGDVERWAQRTKETIRDATTLLDRQRIAGKLSAQRAAEAEVLVRRRDHYLTWVEEVADLVGDDGGSRIRIHGDYHLGQVLRTKSDSFVVIDFEGEPTRSLVERREKTSALRDVAGMLRSLAYAAATLVRGEDSSSKKDARTPAERELVSGRWERDARAAFLRGYTGRMEDKGGLFPRDPKHFDALLSLFEAEKAFYELAYELNHRPGWEWIPMRGISRLLVK
jgi:maltose alpha-D-glucosyltransferase/alpha-amylase